MSSNVNRREFLSSIGLAAASTALPTRPLKAWATGTSKTMEIRGKRGERPYGSGYFGEWITDQFGLPAYHYTCDQVTDSKAVTPVDDENFRTATDQTHQVGNDRLVAAVSNYGYVQVRQDEGSPKFLNDYAPLRGLYGGGIGYLTDGKSVVSTFYPGNAKTFDRVFGMGYLRKKVATNTYSVDQAIFAPFGDDPVMISQVTIANHSQSRAKLRWVEYWGCQMYQFSYRSWMEGAVYPSGDATVLRRDFSERFSHRFQRIKDNLGLMETKHFLGRTPQEERLWQAAQRKRGVSIYSPVSEACMEDLHPPATFLVSLDAKADGFATDARSFFGAGGVSCPKGLSRNLDGNLNACGSESAFLLEREVSLEPGQSRTMQFLYGYLPKGADLSPLIQKYQANPSALWANSSEKWKQSGLHFSVESEPWVEREAAWSHYYLRSGRTYDDFFQEHIISQGGIWQYIEGFQGAARDPLQHGLPFIFTDPKIMKGILRYTLKEIRQDRTIPYGITGSGMTLPVKEDDASDLYLWLLWAASEYVLATRDKAFLDEELTTYPIYGPPARNQSVRSLLAQCYSQMVAEVGTGPHKVMRMLRDDWADGLERATVPENMRANCALVSESVLNSAMASYVFDYYAQMLSYAGIDHAQSADAAQKAEESRQAVRSQWTGRWFRRAWLGPQLGWVGEDTIWLSPQPWAIVGGITTSEQNRELVKVIDELLRRPSPIGAMQIGKGCRFAKKWGAGFGAGTDGAVWPALNWSLIWALAWLDGEMAWEEWKKNTLARHAEVYPNLWYGIWSGPDSYRSALNQYPGTNGPDFPVMNMHSHAWPLYSAAKLLGLEFTADGLKLKPLLPMDTYEFRSPLLGFIKSNSGYRGWYAPTGTAGAWKIVLHLPPEEMKKLSRKRINDAWLPLRTGQNGAVEIRGESTHEKPLHWLVSR